MLESVRHWRSFPALNYATREDDEWFEEPDDLERAQRALNPMGAIDSQ